MQKIVTDEQLKQEYADCMKKIDYNQILKESCIVFVYNSIRSITKDDPHISECVYDDEIHLIEDAFHICPKIHVLMVDGEDKFMRQAKSYKERYRYIFVYSMAQNLFGTGRRCLIPLLCEYYGFINLSSDSASSFLGGNKQLMHILLQNYVSQPNRLFLTEINRQKINTFMARHRNILLKPNSESASIGVQKIDANMSGSAIEKIIEDGIRTYRTIILEEYIEGDEVECTIVPWKNDLYIGCPVKILKRGDYLDYKTVAVDNYDFKPYHNLVDTIKEQALKAYHTLKFNSIARFDFMVCDDSTFLFDITPNPTISTNSSANKSTKYLGDERSIYRLLLLNKLFVPPFVEAK